MEFKIERKLETLKIGNEIHSTFVDDITLAPEIIKPGMKLEDGKLVHCKVKENNDNSIPGDMRTMLLITEIANRIDPIIKVTFDVASNYDDNMVPILDVKVGLNKDGKIVYKFYRKPIASKLLTHRNSAMSMNKKMEIVTQECFKRLHNTSDLMDSETKISLLTEFMRDLKSSGYNESERETVLEGGIKTYANLKSKAEKGIRPFFRSNSYEKEKRMKEKKDKRDNWYKSKNDSESIYKTVMFVEATPGDELLKMLKETEEKFKISDNHRIKFISKSGMKLGQMLQRKDPFLKVCDCKPSINAFEKTGKIIDCKKNNVHYEAACRKCNENGIVRKYDGETARNIHTRSKEHYDNLKNKSEKSWMLRHVLNEHKEDPESVEFDWKIVEKFTKPLERQLSEAISISKKDKDENLNSKSEFFRNKVQRLGIIDEEMFICKYCSREFYEKKYLSSHIEAIHERQTCEKCNYISYGSYDMNLHIENKHENKKSTDDNCE